MSVTVRRLGPGDLADFRAIRLDALRTDPDSFGSTFELEAARPEQDFAVRLASAAVFGAYAGTGIVGLAGFTRDAGHSEGHKGHVWGVFVQPGHRRHGVARALMDPVLAHADATVEIVTLSVTAGKSATVLYERLGFATYGVLPRSLCRAGRYLDEVMMVRPAPAAAHRD